jgi:hypothetical protein
LHLNLLRHHRQMLQLQLQKDYLMMDRQILPLRLLTLQNHRLQNYQKNLHHLQHMLLKNL